MKKYIKEIEKIKGKRVKYIEGTSFILSDNTFVTLTDDVEFIFRKMGWDFPKPEHDFKIGKDKFFYYNSDYTKIVKED